jgi:truncated hemoglobin YjbI
MIGGILGYDFEDILKKALLDTQEKVRDFMHYTREMKDENLQSFFKEAAEEEAKQARRLQQFLGEIR